MQRIQEMENDIIKSFDMQGTTLTSMFDQYEEILYNGGIRRFKPLQDYIKSHGSKAGQISEIEIDKASLAFTRLMIDKYLRRRHGLDNFLKHVEINAGEKEESD